MPANGSFPTKFYLGTNLHVAMHLTKEPGNNDPYVNYPNVHEEAELRRSLHNRREASIEYNKNIFAQIDKLIKEHGESYKNSAEVTKLKSQLISEENPKL
ncbi:UNVERIFIED_CONTAM: hypothetical protein O8I53_13270 [Campylobacter lari]